MNTPKNKKYKNIPRAVRIRLNKSTMSPQLWTSRVKCSWITIYRIFINKSNVPARNRTSRFTLTRGSVIIHVTEILRPWRRAPHLFIYNKSILYPVLLINKFILTETQQGAIWVNINIDNRLYVSGID